MKNGIDIRPVSEQDFLSVCSLEQGVSGSWYQAAVFVRQAMTIWPRSFLVAETDGSPVAYLICLIYPEDPRVSWIIRIRVISEMRRQGIGTAMLTRAHEILQGMGADLVCLSCSPENEGALSLYTRIGYIVIRHETGYFGPGEDRLILSKNPVL